ncbi:penicillin-binding protein 1C [Cellulophaga sp. HaHaR_3_176]|uniref:penicillin-binding protein 1C n=1 Tax=Cellulophaga sp. HaHaR_3_176 TaxID=1942464 RepID=UPI001C1FDAD5|nr:penicillin-binding protein 1C [Cellulophaga sp. HaHaR_3_176]QWX83412.1 penicillin-binding protein 1C [Cellulophaga sp. HaHaR_3_176]
MKEKILQFLKNNLKKTIAIAVLLVAYYLCLPKILFTAPTATVVESKQGVLLGAKIADDGQWRFPVVDSVPIKFKTCLLNFEDAYFYKHPGFNPVSMIKAIGANYKAGKTVRGGSTITQQVIRLSRENQKRSYGEKLIELILATRLEFRYSKDDILKLYASHAPFGGNVVGLEVAAWRYFGLLPHQLSWAESATLAVLPNAPSLIYPGKNQEKLLTKRNRLLKKILEEKIIDKTTYELALLEGLPNKPYALPRLAPHFIQLVSKTKKGERVKATLDHNIQQNANVILKRHYQSLKQNQVYNAAVLVLDVKTRNVLAYVGNTPTDGLHEKDVDMVQANRSTGSVIKPLLYTAMLDAGELLPDMLVPDIPTQIAGYTPENFNENYSGAIEAKKALARSLNIPAVRLLQSYGLQKFRDQLDNFDLKGINKSADHYGLTLILGGAESNLWDLCKTYANLASTVNHFNTTSSEYYSNEFTQPIWNAIEKVEFGKKTTNAIQFDAASIYLTFEAMKDVNRPEGSESWEFYDSSKKIAWKTGTSFGNKDAWAIGTTTDYVVGVWVGNADGEGRPNVTGVSSAAPILFDVFDVLPKSDWFLKPLDEFAEVNVCADSGYLASENCPTNTIDIPNKRNYVEVCSYHKTIQLDQNKQFRVNSSCEDLSKTTTEPWFVLPPILEYYYKKTHPTYKSLPSYRSDCVPVHVATMQFIYPRDRSKIMLAKNFEGKRNELILKLAHAKPETKVFWYLDTTFIKETKDFHEIGLLPDVGSHIISVVDELGNEASITITIE